MSVGAAVRAALLTDPTSALEVVDDLKLAGLS